ncbi:MAG: hypothetical protein ACRDHP_11360, partial [Ktedonobacterales bacterium]
MRRRRLIALACMCCVLALLVSGASLIVRAAHAHPRSGNVSRTGAASGATSGISNPACSRWAAYGGPNNGQYDNGLDAVAAVPNSTQVWAAGQYVSSSAIYHNQTLIVHYDGAQW